MPKFCKKEVVWLHWYPIFPSGNTLSYKREAQQAKYGILMLGWSWIHGNGKYFIWSSAGLSICCNCTLLILLTLKVWQRSDHLIADKLIFHERAQYIATDCLFCLRNFFELVIQTVHIVSWLIYTRSLWVPGKTYFCNKLVWYMDKLVWYMGYNLQEVSYNL